MAITTHSKSFLGRTLTLESGKLAKLASGSVTVRFGDTLILVTATVSKKAKSGIDFFPLLVDYQEKLYASGKIKGSRFIKREGRPSDSAILAGRMIDRPLRPMFPKGMRNDVQVVVTILSADLENNPEDLAIFGSSAACLLMNAGFEEPVAGVRVGLVKNAEGKEEFVFNPTYTQIQEGRMDLMVAGTESAITMIENASKEVDAETIVKALEQAHVHIQELCRLQKEFVAQAGRAVAIPLTIESIPEEVLTTVSSFVTKEKVMSLFGKSKQDFEDAQRALFTETQEHFAEQIGADDGKNIWTTMWVNEVVHKQLKKYMRESILLEGKRLDLRGLEDIRPISCETGLIPRTHGSGLFNRGETQVLSLATLGSPGDAQVVDEMDDTEAKRYMHHYNFPGFSVGEVSPMRGTGRREIGHGDLAERSLLPVLPPQDQFPYTIRVVSEVLGSNGSTSMGSVCGSTLCLMDAGVPIARPVSGIAMGLIMDEQGNYKILSDIQGQEDFLGDMDFKVAGTTAGITALQLDIKIQGLTMEILKKALAQADKGRAFILNKMLEVIQTPKAELSPYAPRVLMLTIRQDQIGEVIGSGGKTIRAITEATGAKIDIEQEGDKGMVHISAVDLQKAEAALAWVKSIVFTPEPGQEFDGKVTRVTTFGAFVEIAPGKEGLVHISELAPVRIARVEEVANVGDTLHVRVKEVDDQGRINLTHKPFSKINPQNNG